MGDVSVIVIIITLLVNGLKSIFLFRSLLPLSSSMIAYKTHVRRCRAQHGSMRFISKNAYETSELLKRVNGVRQEQHSARDT